MSGIFLKAFFFLSFPCIAQASSLVSSEVKGVIFPLENRISEALLLFQTLMVGFH